MSGDFRMSLVRGKIMNSSLHIGGLIAVGFDSQVKFMLTVSHSGRRLYELSTMKMVERDSMIVYPQDNLILGIGPIIDLMINVQEKDYDNETLHGQSPDGKFLFRYDDGILSLTKCT
jgi:hypothetical protein